MSNAFATSEVRGIECTTSPITPLIVHLVGLARIEHEVRHDLQHSSFGDMFVLQVVIGLTLLGADNAPTKDKAQLSVGLGNLEFEKLVIVRQCNPSRVVMKSLHHPAYPVNRFASFRHI